ncbi:5-carboxymethyl-2-hydroxymuconate Delta-isomerase [Paremcibacter congregatus]|uniref:5-carboxymethyl-2-hydroxymuconate isomerase n=1 Tax=Paremcibacter congregatus TaxID=2043170 RepID=A0A2G4YTH5_9PROT|nr:5-carboxymethyl-2-hydroxymuconate Delta-isomerase [Paremcibacter congregatus]PHZ85642.1 5-carboxymethyl-2-hydroxymuconate isomerase [Paremcibacter congregatus]QDE26602.1 5-carboxymethyl-2-hydroxymuconate Delta-isomerase [Paremcibacter congregatus]
MPHLVIEYAKDLEPQLTPGQLIEKAFGGAVQSGLFTTDDIKIRVRAYEDYQIGTGENRFINITAHILSGRTVAQKSSLTDAILMQLKSLKLGAIELTVQVYNIERETYAKARF